MSIEYKDKPYSQFPDSLDTFEDMNDISADIIEDMVIWQDLVQKKQVSAAYEFLEKHPSLQSCIVNAEKINKLQDAVVCLERWLTLGKGQVIASTIDGGLFTETDFDTVSLHNFASSAHSNMIADGGEYSVIENGITALEEHVTDENAHPNIILDGNIN